MPKPTTISEVLVELDLIIEHSIATNDRLGLFAYIYRRTTAEILKEVELGNFENNAQLEQMDVAFANLYLKAYHDFKNGKPVNQCWEFSFRCKEEPLTILQHIMLGINAHINLDLGIATSETMKGKEIKGIEKDFNAVNTVLFQITNEMQKRLGRVSPLLFLLDVVGLKSDEKIIDFSMRKAREQSWHSASFLHSIPVTEKKDAIKDIDDVVVALSIIIKDPKSFLIRTGLKFIRFFEEKNVGKIITKLKEN
ncbi:DUF5995 family protein [uncultured Maribacter sp.]|uniref:DUF5995 family protein n=1 Tax=uncultured Maribacter sp. TaxID=431308 RepID=UPI002614B13A|nr:DUF5995 family protein [uncultured Maribacter sp.]